VCAALCGCVEGVGSPLCHTHALPVHPLHLCHLKARPLDPAARRKSKEVYKIQIDDRIVFKQLVVEKQARLSLDTQNLP